ncbi:hypothetical protein SynPROSU1_01457 [Synechococcus sp. PROS-U-1]|nr:hypothetical protein SynPROSU1_01457 [Synechococcus sp. PROS-U-1]
MQRAQGTPRYDQKKGQGTTLALQRTVLCDRTISIMYLLATNATGASTHRLVCSRKSKGS